MADVLRLTAGFALGMAALYRFAMRAAPGRGFMRVVERMVCGIILCYVCHVLMKPLGVHVPQNPLAALSAGFLGLPGVMLAVFGG